MQLIHSLWQVVQVGWWGPTRGRDKSSLAWTQESQWKDGTRWKKMEQGICQMHCTMTGMRKWKKNVTSMRWKYSMKIIENCPSKFHKWLHSNDHCEVKTNNWTAKRKRRWPTSPMMIGQSFKSTPCEKMKRPGKKIFVRICEDMICLDYQTNWVVVFVDCYYIYT